MICQDKEGEIILANSKAKYPVLTKIWNSTGPDINYRILFEYNF